MVQRRFSKTALELKNMNYSQRLAKLNLTTLKERRERGDLIQHFKSVKGINTIKWYHPNQYAPSSTAQGPARNLRGHNQKLNRQFVRSCDQRNNFFTNRIVPFWNALSPHAIESKTTNQFKNRIDKINEEKATKASAAKAGFRQLPCFIEN